MTASVSSGRPLRPLRSLLSDVGNTFSSNRPELLSSATARLVTILLLHPLDAVKARLQASTATSPLALRAARQGPPLAGLLPAMLAHAPGGIFAFVIYERINRALRARSQPYIHPASVAAACMADAVAALWFAPLEAAKLRMQTAAAPTTAAAFRGAGFYSIVAQIVRDVPFRALHLGLYETVRRAAAEKRGKPFSMKEGAAVGAVVGAAVGAVTTPLDVIKTRVMAQRSGYAKAYEGWIMCAKRTVKVEGVQGLFRGVGQRAVYMGVSVALFSAAYEVCRKAWKDGRVNFAEVPVPLKRKSAFVDAPAPAL